MRRGWAVLVAIVVAIVAHVPAGALAQGVTPSGPSGTPLRTIAIEERLAQDAGIHVGDTVVIAGAPDAVGDRVIVAAITRRGADPGDVAHQEYRIRVHLDQLQTLIGYGDRVDRFAVATRDPARDTALDPTRDPATPVGVPAGMASVLRTINDVAFGFRAYPSRAIAVETSKTYLVVNRFHRAIGVITIVASAIFLLCIMLLKVDERRRDVAALRLMGISAASVVRSVVLEAALVAVLGSVLGVGIGALASAIVNVHYQGVYRTPLRFAIISPEIVGFAVVLSIVLGVVAGLLASLRLVRTPPLTLFGR